MHEDVKDVPHPAATFLEDLRTKGAPAKADDAEWTPEERDNKFCRGAHATAEMNRAFVREEMAEFMECGHWTALPCSIAGLILGLRMSPLGVKEERARKARLICDHSFFGINQGTVLRTPSEAMQFGGTLNRILRAIRHADPELGDVYLSKFDIKDGFYRLFLQASDAPMLGVTLPHYEGEEPLIAIPLVRTMGWAESPPTFCSMSETIADLANANAYKLHVPPHRLERHCLPMDQWNAPRPGVMLDSDSDSDSAARTKTGPGRLGLETVTRTCLRRSDSHSDSESDSDSDELPWYCPDTLKNSNPIQYSYMYKGLRLY